MDITLDINENIFKITQQNKEVTLQVSNHDVNFNVTGRKGPKGDQGDDGIQGDPGQDGDSAYQIAVDNGFLGTENEWLASLVGEQGEAGQNGQGVPTGGTTNQALTKNSNSNYDTEWSTIDKSFVGLGNVDNTSDANKPISNATQTALDGKVDENSTITGATKTKITYDAKGLVTAGADATQDDIGDGITYKQYSQTEKTKLAGIATGAEVNVNADWNSASGDSQILNKPDLGTAALEDVGNFATAAQGSLADSSVQPGDNVSDLVNDAGYLTESASSSDSFVWKFDDSTTQSDPGSGYFRLNDVFEVATEIYIDNQESNAVNVTDWLASIASIPNITKGILKIYKNSDPTSFIIYSIQDSQADTGFYILSVTPLDSNGSFTSEDEISFVFSPSGSAGSGANIQWLGNWLTDYDYTVDNIVSHNNDLYACVNTHHSGDQDDEPGVGADWESYWVLLIDGPADLTFNWGDITGTISDQTDLQAALDGKADSLGADDNYVTDAEKIKLSNLSGTNTGDQNLAPYLTIASATASYQPLDSDLTTIAANITAAGHALIDDATVADQRTTLGLVAGGTGDIWVEKAGDTMTGALAITLATGNSLVIDTTGLVYDASNNRVGIGTATPAEALHIVTSDYATMRFDGASDRGFFYTDGVFHFVVFGGSTDADIRIVRNSVARMDMSATETVFNDPGNDVDFRIEGDTATNLFVINAGLDAVQIGTTTAGVLADFRASTIVFNENSADIDIRFESDGNANLLFLDGGANRIGIGTATPSRILHIRDNNAVALIERDTGSAAFIFAAYNSSFSSIIKGFTVGVSTSSQFLIDDLGAAVTGAGTNRLAIGNTEVVWNETGADVDFRVEGDTSANLFFVDAGTDRIGVSTGSPNSRLQVNGSFSTPITSVAVTSTADVSNFTYKVDASGGARTINLPAASGVTGRIYVIKKIDNSGNAVTIDGNASETIDGATTFSLATQWKYAMIQSDGTNWMIIANN